jgi:hypothetical protein
MVEQCQYFLVVPESLVETADEFSSALGNPSGIRATFSKWPPDGGDIDNIIISNPEYWVTAFLAFDLAEDGTPSREALEGYLNQNPELESLMWVRSKNPYDPNTPSNEIDKVVASNWDAFPIDSTVGWGSVYAALEEL